MCILFEICEKRPFQKRRGRGGVGDHIFEHRAVDGTLHKTEHFDRRGSPCVVRGLFLGTVHGAQGGGGNGRSCFGFGHRLHNDVRDFEMVQKLGLANLST